MVSIFILIILILINGVFSATEIAFLSINKYQLNKEVKKGNKKAIKIIKLLEDSSSFLSAIQISITLSGFLASAFAAENFAGELASLFTPTLVSVETLTTIFVVIITLILSYFTLVFGELVPKKIGLAYSNQISFGMVNVIDTVIHIFKPIIFILKVSTDKVVKLLGVRENKVNPEAELISNIEEASLDELEKQVLLNVFDFDDVLVEDVMTPLKDVVTIKYNSSMEDILKIIKKSKYTRFPVVKNKEVIGILNIKDLVINHNDKFVLNDFIRKSQSIKSNMIIDDAFLYLNSRCEGMAIVTKDKEFIGVVTVEDIVESLIGNIFDEYDKKDEEVL